MCLSFFEQNKMTEKKINQGKCILVCAGEFVPIEIPVEQEDYVIAVDGGFAYCRMLGIEPNLIIGDFDSVSDTDTAQLQQMEMDDADKVKRLRPEKDDTDTIAAVRIGLEKGYRKFFFYGALGGRLDHSIANIQTLLFLKKKGAVGYLLTHSNLITVIRNEEITFHRGVEGRLSLFSLGECAKGVTIAGMKYSLENAVVTNDFPIGISNEFLPEQEGRVCVKEGELLIMVEWE